MRGRPNQISKELCDRVGELHRLGLHYAEIGEKLDISRAAVGNILKRMRMVKAREKPAVPIDDIAPLWGAGYRIVVIASMLGATPSAISSRVDYARQHGDTRFPMRAVGCGRAKRDAPATLKIPCLTCRRPFLSAGPSNRMCADCRLSASDVSPYDPDPCVLESRGRRVTAPSARVG